MSCASFFNSGDAAAGGFVLSPNKPNLNMLRSVYISDGFKVLNPAHLLRNTLALANSRGFKIEKGEFGLRLVLQDVWSTDIAKYMAKHAICELRLNYNPVKRVSVGHLDFLGELPSLEGLVVLDHTIKNFSPIDQMKSLRSLSLGQGISDPKNSVSLLSLPRLECLYLAERIPNEADVFACFGLKKLALTKFPGKMPSESFSGLVNLRYLSLSACGLSEIEGISTLRSLQEVHLALMKHLRSLHGIELLFAMRVLKVESSPHIESLEPLRNLHELQMLWLYDCGAVDSLGPITELIKLEEILLGGSTKVLDGNLDMLGRLPRIKRVGVTHYPHYSLDKAEIARLNAGNR